MSASPIAPVVPRAAGANPPVVAAPAAQAPITLPDTGSISGNVLLLAASLSAGQATSNSYLKDSADHLKTGNDIQTTANAYRKDSADHLKTGNDIQTTANAYRKDSADHLKTGNDLHRVTNDHALRAAMALERIDEKLHVLHERDSHFEVLRIQIDEHHRRLHGIAEQLDRLQGRVGGDERVGDVITGVTQEQLGALTDMVNRLHERFEAFVRDRNPSRTRGGSGAG
jgi:hypothetical protein